MIDYILALYPLYQSLELIKKPLNGPMKNVLVFWIVWINMTMVTSLIHKVLWWFPVIQLFDLLKYLIFISLYQPNISEQFRVIFLVQLWKHSKKYIRQFYFFTRDYSLNKYPNTQHYFLFLDKYLQLDNHTQLKKKIEKSKINETKEKDPA